MTVMSAPVAHAVGACRTHNIVAMRTARPKQIMAGIDPLTAEIPRQEETDDDRREYRPIQDLERPFPVCTALSDTLGDRDSAACLVHDALQLQARTHRGAPAMGARGCAERAVGGIGSA